MTDLKRIQSSLSCAVFYFFCGGLFLLVNLFPPISRSAEVAAGPDQVKHQRGIESTTKCGTLGFAVYEKWQKPVGLFPFYQDACKLGYVDTRGKVVIEPKFDSAGSFYEGLAAVGVKINEKPRYGFIDHAGQFVIDAEFEGAHHFSDELAGVRLGNKWGYIDRTGAVVISPQFAEVTPFYLGLARVRIFTDEGTFRGRWGCINKKVSS